MRLLVVSDTHGRVQTAMNIYKMEQRKAPIDKIVHLGDLVTDAKALETRLGAEVIFVQGNCDGGEACEDYKVLDTEYGRLLLCHGHVENVKFSTLSLLYKAEEMGCCAAFFGHTHAPCFREVDGMYLLNPGSLTLPRGGGAGSYAIVETSEKSLRAWILYEPPARPAVTKGVLRDILNNSDRA